MQQADDDEQHHDGKDDGEVAQPGRVGVMKEVAAVKASATERQPIVTR